LLIFSALLLEGIIGTYLARKIELFGDGDDGDGDAFLLETQTAHALEGQLT